MNRAVRGWVLIAGSLLLGCVNSAVADFDHDMRYWGYSNDVMREARKAVDETHVQESTKPTPAAVGAKAPAPVDEASLVQEQLTELGRTRSLHPETPFAIERAKSRLHNYWDEMGGTQRTRETIAMPAAERDELNRRIRAALEEKGYRIVRFDLIDTIPNLGQPQVRAWIRVSRAPTSKDPYREAQKNLAEVRELATGAATRDGFCALSEMTIFVNEDPKSKKYYEKTILVP